MIRNINLLRRTFTTHNFNKYKNVSKVDATIKNVFASEDKPHAWGQVFILI